MSDEKKIGATDIMTELQSARAELRGAVGGCAKAIEALPTLESIKALIRDAIDQSEQRILAALATRPAGSAGAAPKPSASPSSSAGLCVGNYGRRKNEPVAGMPIPDLEYYGEGCRRTLNDPNKSRWHAKEQILLDAIEAEIARQRANPAQSSMSAVGSYSDTPAGAPPDFGAGGGDDSIPF